VLHRDGERRSGVLAERALEPAYRGPDRVEIRRRGEPRLRLKCLLEGARRLLRLLDSFRRLALPQIGEGRAQAGEIAAARSLLGHLAEPCDRRRVMDETPALDRAAVVVEREPRMGARGLVRAEIDTPCLERLRSEDARDALTGRGKGGSRRSDALEVVAQRHGASIDSAAVSDSGAASRRTQHARELFAPLGPTYDRYARLLSFGQDPRWRAFLVARIPDDALRVADVASGTAAVSIALARAVKARTVAGVDQSAEMLAAGRARVEQAGLGDRIELREGRAESLPFADAEFDALTFTYLLRYVDDPAATLRELARVVRPGGTIAMQEFAVPRGIWRPLWELYMRVGLPLAGAAVSPGWHEVGSFLGPSIRGFYERLPVGAQLDLWRGAGIDNVQHRTLSVGGGIVVWGTRA
jgi:demethylmenaquinone methyltransferase/2-methoxy-6-polyprenyl-1,4-benzoquinol methylase